MPLDQEAVRTAIRTAMDGLEGPSRLRMAGISLREGICSVRCLDEYTRQWVQMVVEGMARSFRLGTGAPPGTGPVTRFRFGVWVTGPPGWVAQGRNLFPVWDKHNPGLETRNWRLYSSTPKGSGYCLIIGLDAAGSDWILDPKRKIHYYSDLLTFTIRSRGSSRGQRSGTSGGQRTETVREEELTQGERVDGDKPPETATDPNGNTE